MTASLAALLVGTVLHAPPALAAEPAPTPTPTSSSNPAIVVPPLVTESWNGTTGVNRLDELWRQAVTREANSTTEPEIRDAALAALATGDPAVIQRYATVEQPALIKQVQARKQQEAADNLAKIKALKGTGGLYFNAEVERVLAGSDRDRADFLAYGADISRDRDAKVTADATERAATLRQRVEMIATTAPVESNVKQAAQAALAGDDAAITAFLNSGYLTAARADAAEHEQYLKDLEARNKAMEELSDLAQKSARANEARQQLLVAHGQGVRALQQAANAMGGAANAARHATRILADSGTAESKNTELTVAITETKRQLGYAQQAADEAQRSAQMAKSAADAIDATGLQYGVEWADIAQGMSEAAAAAAGATQTAVHASDATLATNNAQGAQAQAEAQAQQAVKWRQHAQQHAASAAKLAAAAAKQATAAKTAAARANKAREQAQAAEAKAWEQAEKTRQQRQIAEAQAAEAKRQRQIAQEQAAIAAQKRAEAEQQAAIARFERANAEAQAAPADAAFQRAEAADNAAGAADARAWTKEGEARAARDEAKAQERAEQTAKAQQAAWQAAELHAASNSEKEEARRQADQAGREASSAGASARSSRASANAATGAAANARAAATQAQHAAERAWAAARKARAAAAAADAAADNAETLAKDTRASQVRADAKAAEATAQQVKATRAAEEAVRLAGLATDEAIQSLTAANRTKDAAEAATTEAVAAAAQAEIAVNAASAARQSAAGIAEPANTAIAMVSPFTGADIDADFVKLVAEQAQSIGAEQVSAAQARAQEALTAAAKAEQAAAQANEQIPGAFTASANAAKSAATAAKSAAEAKTVAAQAAAYVATAREAAAGAARAGAQARMDALAARQAANEAASDASIAGKAAAAAQAEANAANSAATAAENDAAAARDAAARAEVSAAKAQEAAANAEKHADSATAAAGQALQHAQEALQAAERAEDAERQRLANAIADAVEGTTAPSDPSETGQLTPEDQEKLRQAEADAGLNIMDFLEAEGGDLFLELSGAADLAACFRDGNVEACLWTAASALGPVKGYRVLKKLLELAPKIKKFADRIKIAQKTRDELRALAKRLEAACPFLPSSFLPGTPVLLADGKTKAIDKLQVGDVVLSTDPVTGATATQIVSRTISSAGEKKLVDIVIDVDGPRGHRTDTITATEAHPFWVPALSQWVDAADLAPKQWLRTGAGTTVAISAIRHHSANLRVHNLTVEGFHTYYVVAGGRSLLVHNADCPSDDIGLQHAKDASRKFKFPGGMNGALFIPGGGLYPLSTGERNIHPAAVGKPAPGTAKGYGHHLEAQSAALMHVWMTGWKDEDKKATLFITGDYICGACNDTLETMLPKNAELTVVYRDKNGIQRETYKGR